MGKWFICALFILSTLPLVCAAQRRPPDFRSQLANAVTDTQKLNIYRSIFTYYNNSNTDSVVSYLEKGAEEFTSSGYQRGKAAVLAMLAGGYSEQGRAELAERTANDALKIFKELGDEKSIAKSHNSIGVIEGRKGKYSDAIRHFLLALRYFEQTADTENIIQTYIRLGAANDLSGNDDMALKYLTNGLQLSLKSRNPPNPAPLYNNIGSIYAARHQYEKALEQLNKAVAAASGPRYAEARISPLMNIGNIYNEKGDVVKARSYYEEALKLAKAAGAKVEVGKLLHSIGLLENITMRRPSNSMLEALAIAREAGNKHLQISILKDLAKVADANGEYQDEVSYLKQERQLSDSIFNIEKEKEIAGLQSEYELRKSKSELLALRESERKNQQKKNLIILVAVVLAATLATIIFFFRRTALLNRKLSIREQELQKANDTKDRLFSIIGHDLRGPVANIPALIGIYRSEDTPDETKDFILDSLEENSIASLETLEKLLKWGNLQIKGNTINRSVFEMTGVMSNCLRLLNVAAANKNITIINRVPDHIQVYADENHFNFIMRNLLANAIKYTQTDGVIEVEASEYTNKSYILFAVKDNGIGIETERQPHIFTPHHTSTAGTANESGTSIGLMLCKEFIQQNNGDIWVESQKGKGSTFYFTVMGQYHREPSGAEITA